MSRRSSTKGTEHHEETLDLVPGKKAKQFIAEKSQMVRDLRACGRGHIWETWSPQENHKDFFAVLPPLDSFMGVDKRDAEDHIWNGFERGNLVIVRVSSIRERGLSAVLLALDGGKSLDVEHHKIHAWCDISEIPKETNHEDVLLRFSSGDILRCVILRVNARDSELVVSMCKTPGLQFNIQLGRIEDEELPLSYRRQLSTDDPYEDVLTKSVSFVNPNNVEYLMSRLKVPSENIVISLMKGLHSKHFSIEESADYLRKKQSRKVAEKSVKRGIEKFKKNEYIEALHDFNYALDMDTENVDALVARGALYANRGSFSKAIHDFEGALKFEPQHRNAKKYLVEVLVERAKQIESQMDDVQQVKEVEKCYNQALRLDPNCEEAGKALGRIEEDRQKNELEGSSSNSDSIEKDSYAATAEKLRKIIKEESDLSKKTMSRSSSTFVKNYHDSRTKTTDSQNGTPETSSSSSSSTSSSSSSEDERSQKRRKRSTNSSSSSTSSSDDRTSKTRQPHKRRDSNYSKTISKRTESPLDERKRRSASSQRRKSGSSSNSSVRRATEKCRHSDLAKTGSYHAIIHSRNSRTGREGNTDARSPLDKRYTDTDRRKLGKTPSANIAKITKDNFNDILKEILKFENASKSGR